LQTAVQRLILKLPGKQAMCKFFSCVIFIEL
jgi:hypothetical protein